MPARAAVRYEEDVYSWSREQAEALRRVAASRVNLPEPVDFLNIAEEIESLGISQLNELYSRYRVLLMHLLKWQFQPEKRSPSWRKTIRTQRDLIARLLRQSPGLKPTRRREPWRNARASARPPRRTATPLRRPGGCARRHRRISARQWRARRRRS